MASSSGRRSVVRRILRYVRMLGRSMLAARGLAGKWAMARGITGRLRSLLGRAGRAREITIVTRDVTMTIDVARSEIAGYWEIWHDGSYEDLPQFKAGDGSCVVDVGGNVGFFAMRQALRAPRARIFTFEPSPSVYRRLVRNIHDNHLNNVAASNTALGQECGTVHFLERAASINNAVVAKASEDTVDVACETLDEAMARYGVDHINILKIDTEGFERQVLAGGAKTLPCVDRIVLEVHGGIGERQAIDDALAQFGFSPVMRRGSLAYYERGASAVPPADHP